MKKLKFFKCTNCGNVIVKIVDKNAPLFCCGKEMVELEANTQDASTEKHMPVVKIDNNLVKVSVGSILHPMQEEHFINFIVLQTNFGYKIINLTCQDSPEVVFALSEGETCENVYEYCNLHGLWKLELNK